MNGIVAGNVDFDADGTGDPVGTVEHALGTEFKLYNEDNDGARHYHGGVILGMRFSLELRRRDDGGHSGTVSYRSDDPFYTTEGDVVSLDFHLVALLDAAGLKARPTY